MNDVVQPNEASVPFEHSPLQRHPITSRPDAIDQSAALHIFLTETQTNLQPTRRLAYHCIDCYRYLYCVATQPKTDSPGYLPPTFLHAASGVYRYLSVEWSSTETHPPTPSPSAPDVYPIASLSLNGYEG